MKLVKKIVAAGLLLGASVWADEGVFIRNVCDSLVQSSSPKVSLKLAQIEETHWYGDRTLKKRDSVKVKSYTDIKDFAPLPTPSKSVFDGYYMPYSIKAGCSETKNNPFVYAQYSKSRGWELSDGSDRYETVIYDVHAIDFAGYNENNSYNFLAMAEGSLPDNGSYMAGEFMVSKTFEFRFEWWFAGILYTYKDGDYTNYKFGASVAMDSASAVSGAASSLSIPESISQVQLQVVKAVLMDERKIGLDINSSSAMKESSSSAEVTSSASVAPLSASSSSAVEKNSSSSTKTEMSSSSETGKSSSSETVESSSSGEGKSSSSEAVKSCSSDADRSSSSKKDDVTSIAGLKVSPVSAGSRVQVRRLNGSVVAENEILTPGVYYVKTSNGLWKKQMVLPR